MAIFDLLTEAKDIRKENSVCQFNGYLEDYLEVIENEQGTIMQGVLKDLFEKDHDLRICVDFKMNINHEVISNQIIRYKDAFKLSAGALVFPYIIYGKKDNMQRAMIIYPGEGQDYLYAKGLYYCLTEPFSEFVESKNELVSLCSNNKEIIISSFSKLFELKAGALQREIDQMYFQDYWKLKEDALIKASFIKDTIVQKLNESMDRDAIINETVVQWFLIKKVVYVQYMVSKDMLLNTHGGNIKKQRNQAKKYADEIAFISYSDLWRSIQRR